VAGGKQFNVLPATAQAVLNIRTLPGHSIDKVINRLRAIVSEPGVTIEISTRGDDAPASDPDSAMYAAIVHAARDLNPALAVVPYLSTGFTDSSHLRRLGVQAYGILPFPMDEGDERRMHGADERVPLESLHFGVRLIYEATKRVCASG
jgi:acetylornithine deacetylase/succinyl-diaminopimelate desuccinylase-like protein